MAGPDISIVGITAGIVIGEVAQSLPTQVAGGLRHDDLVQRLLDHCHRDCHRTGYHGRVQPGSSAGFTRTFEVDLICDLAVQAASSSAKPRQSSSIYEYAP
jgi:hypothetical protein